MCTVLLRQTPAATRPACLQGSFMAVASPNFGGLFKRQQALEGTYRTLQVGREHERCRLATAMTEM